jgi:serine/threonine protein kinase
MPKLSWLAFSGNPATTSTGTASLEFVEWKDLKLNQVLGQGASGIIYHAERTSGNGTKDVAVKIFKGEVTSDGLPQDEMNTCIAAGQHPGLVKLIGQLNGHPESRQGLVMELIPASFYNLGGPPSLQSCTRDVFSGDLKLTPEQALKVASTIAAVAAQLHERKIMHGDLYAHNILVDQECNTLFGDFGAATFYTNPSFEKIEVNAFGYLLADLLGLCKEDVQNPLLAKLSELQLRCQQELPSSRPTFKLIASELAETLKK